MAERIGEPRRSPRDSVGVSVGQRWVFEDNAWTPLVTPERHEPLLLPTCSCNPVEVGLSASLPPPTGGLPPQGRQGGAVCQSHLQRPGCCGNP